jgi:hypothetical protein
MPLSPPRSSTSKDSLPRESLSEPSLGKSGFTQTYLSFPPKEVTAISIQEWLTIGFCATLPFKLSFTYLFLIPALLFFWFNAHQGVVSIKKEWIRLHYRLIFFIIYAGISACAGLNPFKSLQSLGTLSLLSTTCFLIAWYIQRYGFISLLLPFLGFQAIGSINTLLTYGSHGSVPQIFLGDLTQAGQLAIGLVLGFSCFIDLIIPNPKAITSKLLLWPLLTFTLGIFLAFFSKPALFTFVVPIFVLIVIRQLLDLSKIDSAIRSLPSSNRSRFDLESKTWPLARNLGGNNAHLDDSEAPIFTDLSCAHRARCLIPESNLK